MYICCKLYRMAKVEKQATIEFICNFVRKGANREEILQEFAKKYNLGTRTFDSRLKIAREVVQNEIRAKEEIREATLPETVRSEILEGIATESEIDLIVSQILRGNCSIKTWVNGEAVLEDVQPSDILAAADKLYKRKSSYGEKKVKHILEQGVKGFLLGS